MPTPTTQEYCLLLIDWWPLCMEKAGWAFWIQGIGSVLALLVAIRLARQDKKYRDDNAARDRREWLEMACHASAMATGYVEFAEEILADPDESMFYAMNGRASDTIEDMLYTFRSIPAAAVGPHAMSLLMRTRSSLLTVKHCLERSSAALTSGLAQPGTHDLAPFEKSWRSCAMNLKRCGRLLEGPESLPFLRLMSNGRPPD